MPRFLAIDWDHNQLHVVAATVRGGKVQMERAAVWTEVATPTAADAESFGPVLRERLRTAGIAPAPVLASLARDRIILKDLRFPAVPATEEANVVRFQAVKELTDSPDDVVIDYVPTSAPGSPEQRATVYVARKDIVRTYQALCHSAGLKLMTLTPRTFGIAAAARRAMAVGGALTPKPEPADGAVVVVAVADKWAEFCVMRGETLLVVRSLTVGPHLAAEIRRNLNVYNGQNPQRPVQAAYLCCGPDVELRQRLGDMIDVPIYPFDAFAGAEIEVAGNPGGFSGAAGLLFAQADRVRSSVNFLDPRQAVVPENTMKRRVLIAAGVLLLVVVSLLVTGSVILAGRESEVVAMENTATNLAAEINATKESHKRIAALETWSTVVWPDEVYDLTDRIADVNVLRITSLNGVALSRTGKEKVFTSKLTIEGEFLGRDKSRDSLDKMIEQFRSEKEGPFYGVEVPRVFPDKGTFELTINIKPRPPGKYDRRVPVKPPPAVG